MEVNKVEVHQGKIRIQIMKKDMFKRWHHHCILFRNQDHLCIHKLWQTEVLDHGKVKDQAQELEMTVVLNQQEGLTQDLTLILQGMILPQCKKTVKGWFQLLDLHQETEECLLLQEEISELFSKTQEW